MNRNPQDIINSMQSLLTNIAGVSLDKLPRQSQRSLIESLEKSMNRNSQELSAHIDIIVFTVLSQSPIIEELLTQQEHLQGRMDETKALQAIYEEDCRNLLKQHKTDERQPVPTETRSSAPQKGKAS